MTLNATHDPQRRSLVESANGHGSDFPIQNLPFGIFSRGGDAPRGGIAIGDRIFDLSAATEHGLFSGAGAEAARAATHSTLNPLMALGPGPLSALRAQVSDLLKIDSPQRRAIEKERDRLLVPMSTTTLLLPAEIWGFTDFLCSSFHSQRMSPTGTLPPAFRDLPIAYNSRASSVRMSREPIRRPNVQYKDHDGVVRFGPEPMQDFELELGFFVGEGNGLGTPIPLSQAENHIFGYCLLNDWSSRAAQRWESQPLGPFLSKSVSTTISPWLVTTEALAPFRLNAPPREAGAPPLLPYLADQNNQHNGAIDIWLEAYLVSPTMRAAGRAPERITLTNFRHMYWTPAQMLTHHASNGCNLRPGDLLGSGTTSGPSDETRACLAEITNRGESPIILANGEKRSWLMDGDEVIFRGYAERDGFVRIGFGECRARLEPAVPWPA